MCQGMVHHMLGDGPSCVRGWSINWVFVTKEMRFPWYLYAFHSMRLARPLFLFKFVFNASWTMLTLHLVVMVIMIQLLEIQRTIDVCIHHTPVQPHPRHTLLDLVS